MIKINNITPQTVSIAQSERQSIELAQKYEIHVSGAPTYAGPYDITPTADAQVMETAHKLMTDDVDIRGIPYYEVSNPSGGTTVYIAGNLDD